MKSFILLALVSWTYIISAQSPIQKTSGQLYNDLEKLGVLANVLYVAAHPDDENTRMISYLSNDIKADTRYLSLTRGDGGQNLIGSELKELLGVIRTQELLAARRIDGGSQMFSRANDFGYSKNAEETIKIWDDEKVLSDVVWAIRKFRPDVVINRFDHESSGKTHGHHTASAMLSYEAFDLAGDDAQFSDQLKYVSPWQPKRLFFNTSWWFYGGRDKFAEADKTDLMSIDIGTYYPLLGISNNEMAAYSRSMHKCQGMGNTPQRGSQLEYLKILKGDMPPQKSSIFEGIDITWSRVKNGQPIAAKLNEILKNYNFNHPAHSIKEVIELRKMIAQVDDEYWRTKKLDEVDQLLINLAGLFVETKADRNVYTSGEMIELSTEIVSRLSENVSIETISFTGLEIDTTLSQSLDPNTKIMIDNVALINADMQPTAPYYLKEKGTLGMYKVNDRRIIGSPETRRPFQATYLIKIQDQPISITKDIIYKYTHPERGEVFQPVEILQPYYANIQEDVVIYNGHQSKMVNIKVKGYKTTDQASLTLDLPADWKCEPQNHDFTIDQSGEEVNLAFAVTPPQGASIADIQAIITANDKTYDQSLHIIDYEHIPLQHVALPSHARLVKLDIKTPQKKIVYIEGAGDAIPESLKQLNYPVTVINPESITKELLSKYDVAILGIRAYNKSETIKFKQKDLFAFVENGGTMIVQYTTTWRNKVDQIGPYPIQLSRDRVSVEEAPIRILAPDHPVLNTPNKITQADFDGWVQERGLYFADEWDERYTAILSSNDPGETPKDGGMLIADYGKGHFIFSGYSWFRQLPAGVPGAYRIFANMIGM